MRRRYLGALAPFAFMMGVAAATEPDPALELMAVERAFSARSAAIGFTSALAEVLAEDAVVLQDGSPPVVGKDAVILSRAAGEPPPEAKAQLTWEPMSATVSALRDLGFTYGVYTFRFNGKDGKPRESQGTYATIWRRSDDGAWQVVLDTGTEGLGPPTAD